MGSAVGWLVPALKDDLTKPRAAGDLGLVTSRMTTGGEYAMTDGKCGGEGRGDVRGYEGLRRSAGSFCHRSAVSDLSGHVPLTHPAQSKSL